MRVRERLLSHPHSAAATARIAYPSLMGDNRLQGIKELVDSGLSHVPQKYIHPFHEGPTFSHSDEIPIIDLDGFSGHGRQRVLGQIASACKEFGFFQIVNHGVSQSVINALWEAARRFFDQPAEERMRYYVDDFSAEFSYKTSFNSSKEALLEWKDTLYIQNIPGRFYGLKEAPDFFRVAALNYLQELRILAGGLYEAIFESLGLSPEYLKEALPGIARQILAVHYYPACPDPSLALGLSGHSDISCLTLLLQDSVAGLQIKKGERWIVVKPVPQAFVVNIADQIQILTNGKYKSVEHRAIVNGEQARMSIPCFFGPFEEATISPLEALTDDDKHRPKYKPTLFGDYARNFYSKPLNGKSTLEFSYIE